MARIGDIGQGTSTNNDEGPFVSRHNHWVLREETRENIARMETNVEEHYEEIRNDNK